MQVLSLVRIGTLYALSLPTCNETGEANLDDKTAKALAIGAGIGAVAGAVLPFVSWFVGAGVGAGVVAYKKYRAGNGSR